MEDNDFKKRIVIENTHLPLHEIKKKLRQKYPNVTNEEVEKLVSSIYNSKQSKKCDKDKKQIER